MNVEGGSIFLADPQEAELAEIIQLGQHGVPCGSVVGIEASDH